MVPEPCRIELVGVAGTGKSTLARALVDRLADCRVMDSLHTRLSAHWPYVAHGAPHLLRALARGVGHRPALSWEELKLVVYVSEWDRFLRSQPERRSGVSVLDQGPLFALARLLWGRKPVTKGPWFERWLRDSIGRWSQELYAIVVLTAPEAVLLERINRRQTPHEAKGRPPDEALAVLRSHEDAYRRILAEVERLGHPPVFRYDSSRASALALAEDLVQHVFAPVSDAVDGSSGAFQPGMGSARVGEHAMRGYEEGRLG